MSLYGPSDSDQPSKSGFKCGRSIPGATMGQPHLQAVTCQNRQFEIVLGVIGPDKMTPLTTHCIVCRAQDAMKLLMTNAGGEKGNLLAAAVPALLQHGAAPNMLVCQNCCQFRFALLDEGNEIKRRCIGCGETKHLGYETSVSDQQQRSFTMG